jgi:hypothetical protein
LEIKVYLQFFPFGRNKYITCGIKIITDLFTVVFALPYVAAREKIGEMH